MSCELTWCGKDSKCLIDIWVDELISQEQLTSAHYCCVYICPNELIQRANAPLIPNNIPN